MSVSTIADGIAVTLRRPTSREVVVALALTIGFTLTGGPVGLLAGVTLAIATILIPPVAAFTLGQALFLGVLPTPTLAQLALAQASLFGVLLTRGTETPAANRGVTVVSAAVFGVLASGVWLGIDRVGLLTTAVTVLLVVALASYLLHRYERVSVGLAGGAPT